MISRALFGKKYLDITERCLEIGPVRADGAIVKVHACGVCGTDLNFVRDWPDESRALGHEIAGEVVAVGELVSSVKPGDRVIVEDCSMCGACANCKNGRPDLCRSMWDMNNQPGMGEYVVVHQNQLCKFFGMDYKTASLTEPLAVALTAVMQADIPFGGSVAVLGNGPLGLMAAQTAKLRGAGFVAVTGAGAASAIGKARLEIAPEFGCDLMIDMSQSDLVGTLKKCFPHGVERVIVTAPPQSIHDALAIIGYGGLIVFLGLHFGGRNKVELDVNDLIFRKITLRPVLAEPAMHFPRAAELLRTGQIDSGKLVTHTFGFAEARGVFRGIIEKNLPVIKAVMQPHG